jgi:type II secretory pathway pseudopilin PulG
MTKTELCDMTSQKNEAGMGLLEFLVAMVVLLIGLTGVLALFSHTVIALGFAQQNLIAKQKAREAMESIFTARNTAQVSFDQIRNVSAGGVFLDGLQPLKEPGTDGLVGTSDDGSLEEMVLAGTDELLGTADDEVRPLGGFQRQIQITPVSSDLRQITITLRYSGTQGFTRNYQVVSYISPYR